MYVHPLLKMNQIQPDITYYQSYEAREEAFNHQVGHLIPCRYAGPRRFWNDFSMIIRGGLSETPKLSIAYITGNPRDCLTYGSARQVLTAALMDTHSQNRTDFLTVESLAAKFEIDDLLDQPIRTLSGGETVKLALAKSWAASAYCSTLTIASPFCWLSQTNRKLFLQTTNYYLNRRQTVKLLALEGEDVLDEFPADMLQAKKPENLIANFAFKSVKIPLRPAISAIDAEQEYALIDDCEENLLSPCLLIGGNGQGKSLLAKCLANAIPFQGQAAVKSVKQGEGVRLLFQDVINQTLLRSFEMLSQSQTCSHDLKIAELFESISNRVQANLTGSGTQGQIETDSLLAVKIMLMAIRLCSQPAAIILDEPDWGLTRTAAGAYVTSVIEHAHSLGVAVILISHKPWWQSLSQSVLQVSKHLPADHHHDGCRFSIQCKRIN